MSDFDFNAYLDSKLANVDIGKKMDSLRNASEKKNIKLEAAAAKIDANRNSWAGQTGFNTEDFIGARINDVASLVSGASRVAGHITSLVPNALSMLQTAGATEADYDARRYVVEGTATSAERERAKQFEAADRLRNAGQTANKFFDLTGIVDKTNRDALNEDLGAGFQGEWNKVTTGWDKGNTGDVVSGLAGLLSNAGSAAISNPAAVREYILENAPQLFVGAVNPSLLAASNLGYAADEYTRAITTYQARFGGQLPPEEERQRMALKAASLALAEHAGDKALLGMGKISKALGGADDAATISFKNSLLNIGKAAVGGAITEAATEGYQTYTEETMQNNANVNPKDVYAGAVIGGLSGGALAGGGRAVAEAFKATPEHVAERVQEQTKAVEEAKAVEQAVVEENPAVFLDRASKQYSPAKAIGVMMTLAEKEDTTPEQFQTYLSEAAKVVEKLEIQRDTLDPKKLEASIVEVKAELQATDPADTDEIAALTSEIEGMTSQLADMTDSKSKLSYQNQLKTVDNQLKEAEASFAGFTRMATKVPSAKEVETTLVVANSKEVEASTQAGQALINLSMVSPDELSPDAALKLADNDKNGLNTEQRNYLRQFSEARVAENMLKDQSKVSKEVLFGSQPGSDIKMIGISQYRTSIGSAIAANHEERATRQLKGLRNFAVDHTAKQAIVERAFVMATEEGKNSQIIKQGKEWVFNTGKRLSDAALKKNGGVNVHAKSGVLVSEIINEASALNLAHNQLASAVALRFGKAPVQLPISPAATAVPPVSPASLFREKREREGRLNSDKSEFTEKTPQTVVKEPQVQQKVQENIEPISVPVTSPSATLPVVPVADAPSTRATASASAVSPIKEVIQPVAAEQQAEAPAKAQAAEDATAETAQEDNSPSIGEHGRLSVMTGFKKDDARTSAEKYKDKDFNPVAQHIKQKGTHETNKTHRPLVRIKDFLSKLGNGTVDSFTGLLGNEPNEKEIGAIEHFRSKALKWTGLVKANIGQPGTSDMDFVFRFRDMMQYMVNRDGDTVTVDENLLTAIAYGGYHWAVDTANAPKMTAEKINAMFGRDEDQPVHGAIWAHIKGMHGHEDVTINDIGEMIVQSLGLTLHENAPQDLLPRIKTALGAHALLMLEDAKVLERRAVKRTDIVENLEFLPGEDNSDADMQMMFVFPNYEALQDYKDSNKDTGNVVDKLFAADAGPRFATTKPVKFSQAFAQHTRQEISPEQRNAMDQLHKTPHTVIPEMFKVLKGMGNDAILRIAGALDLEQDSVHITNQRSVEAQNDNLTNQLELMLEMMGDKPLDQQYFVQGEVWKNFRAGIMTRSLNQQTSKIHRYMFGRPNWTVTIDLANEEQHNDLRIAFAAGLGMKTDEQPNNETLELLTTELAKPKVRAAIEAMKAGLTQDDWSNAEAITEYATGAEGMMTLQTLTMLAKYEAADPSGKLEVTMLVGADGKTNGPILTHLALGAASDVNGLLTMMERGGMFANKDGKATHYSESRKSGVQDLYEDLASKLMTFIGKSPEMDALQVITGKFTKDDGSVAKYGRNLVKTPLTAFAFGSSLEGSILAMENKFIASIYEKIEGLSKDLTQARLEEDPAKQEIMLAAVEADKATFIRATNTLLHLGNPKLAKTGEDISIGALMTNEIHKDDETAYRKAFQQLMAAPVKETMESYFAVFIQRRSDLNTTIGAAYAIYREAYASAKQAMMNKLMDEGKMAYHEGTKGKGAGTKYPLHDLTMEQELELRESVKDLLPVAHTAYTVKSGNLAGGIYMGKHEASISNDNLHYTKINVARPVRQAGYGKKAFGNALSTYTMVRNETDPGVAGTPYFIHSLDSANMHYALNDVADSMNVHDEIGNNPLLIKKAAGSINRATVQNLLVFSPAREALHMMERMTIAMAKGIENGTVSQEAVGNMLSSWQDAMHKRLKSMVEPDQRGKVKRPSMYNAAKLMYGMTLDNAIRADQLRLETIAQLGNIDQYVWEGGQFEVTPNIRAEAEQRLKDMNKKMAPEAAKAMETILKFVDTSYVAPADKAIQSDDLPMANKPVGGAAVAAIAGKSTTQETINKMEVIPRAETIQKITEAVQKMPGTGMTEFGLLGTPTMVQEEVQKAFAAKPTMNRQEIISLLASSLKGAYRTILSETAKSLPDNLQVVMVTPDSDPAIVTKAQHENSRGWYVPTKDGSNTIYILSDAFVHSGLNSETLLHELVHAATARELVNPSSKAAKSLVNDLTALVKHLNAQPGAEKFTHILKGENALHEIVAWGMSNQEFQAWMSTIPFKSKTTTNRLTTAFKKFIRILTGGKYRDSALEALLRNTAGVFASAADNTSNISQNLSQVAIPDSYTTAQIYDGLASEVKPLAEVDDTRLRALMLTMVEQLSPVYGVFGLDAQSKTLSAQSAFAIAQTNGIAPFASDSIAHGMGYNEQVAFMLEQVEVTIRTAISGNDGATSLAYSELTKLYNEAEVKLKGKLPQDQYDFLFKMDAKSNDRSDYLSRFAALGLVHPEVHALLNFQTDAELGPSVGMTFTERLSAVFNQIMEWFAGKWTKTQAGQRADSKLNTLAVQLVLIESKRRARLNIAKNKTASALEESFRGVAEGARDKVDEWINAPFFKESSSNMLRAVSSVTSLAVKDRLDYLALAYKEFSDSNFKGNEGMISSLITELQGSKKDNVVFYKLIRMTKFLEGKRKNLISKTSKVILESFVNNGKDLTDTGKKAISSVILRTDMATLRDEFGLDGLLKLMKNKGTLAKAMIDMETKLAGNPQQLFYLNAAEAMGYQMATGDAGVDHTLLNAYAVARLHGTEQMNRVTEEQAAAVQPIIDSLASLYALSFANYTDVQEAVKVFEAEQARTDGGNGIEMVLRMHQNLQKESKARLFKEQEALMMKGYTPEIYNHYIEVTTADESKAANMKAQGYGEGMKLSQDDADPERGSKKMLFARHGSGLLPYLSGAISTTANKTKGDRKHNGNMDFFSDQGQYNADMMRNIQKEKRKAVDEMFKRRIHPGQTTKSYMVPVLNPNGEVVNYRYMMKNRVKDDVLIRDNRFEHLLGAMAGSIFDKQASPKQNRVIVEALKAQYDLEFKTRANSYVEIGPRSPDPVNRERYRLLPQATKDAIRDVWKSDSMHVRNDLVDISFGYRKKSLVDVLQEDPASREGFNKFLAEFLGLMGGRKGIVESDEDRKQREAKATIRIRNAEEIWQTFVKEAKDMIVVKSGSTLIGNVISNMTLLYAYGVPVTDMMRSHRIALRGAMDYMKSNDELFTLQSEIDTGTANDVMKTQRKITQLKDAMARNPVRHLIEAGLMPTIVEDVEVDDDIYSHKSRFIKKLKEYTDKVNPHVLNVGKTLYMAHDTKLYKGMSQATQLSDFLARYTLYQHMTTKKHKPLGNEEAIQLASDAFINYDIPTHRNMQYANDMGLIRFTKYYLRIQKVIMHLYRENPARMLGLMAMGSYFDTVPTVLDSSAFTRIGNNPAEWGALEYLFSFDDLATSKAIMAPF